SRISFKKRSIFSQIKNVLQISSTLTSEIFPNTSFFHLDRDIFERKKANFFRFSSDNLEIRNSLLPHSRITRSRSSTLSYVRKWYREIYSSEGSSISVFTSANV